jgi:hypothetical protein
MCELTNGMAGERHGRGMLCVNRLSVSQRYHCYRTVPHHCADSCMVLGSAGDSATVFCVTSSVAWILKGRLVRITEAKWALYIELACRKVELERHSVFTSPLDVSEWLVSCSNRFIPKERTLFVHWIGGWRAAEATGAKRLQPLQRLGRWFVEFELRRWNKIVPVQWE